MCGLGKRKRQSSEIRSSEHSTHARRTLAGSRARLRGCKFIADVGKPGKNVASMVQSLFDKKVGPKGWTAFDKVGPSANDQMIQQFSANLVHQRGRIQIDRPYLRT